MLLSSLSPLHQWSKVVYAQRSWHNYSAPRNSQPPSHFPILTLISVTSKDATFARVNVGPYFSIREGTRVDGNCGIEGNVELSWGISDESAEVTT